MKKWKWLLIIAAFFLASVIIIHISNLKSPRSEIVEKPRTDMHKVEMETEVQERIGLKTTQARLSPFRKGLSVVGQIAQDVESSAHVMPPLSGTIIESGFQIGSFVKKDAVLCVIKTNGDDSYLEIKAPISGVITGDFAKKGDSVDLVSSIYTIADMSKLWATFDIYEKDISKVKIGQTISIQTVAYPNQIFSGKIIFISPRVDEITRTIKIRATVNNPGYLLKLGMFVEGKISIKSAENYIVLPSEALQTIGDKRIVFVKTNNEFTVKEVEVKEESKDEVAISKGISAGDSVVTEGAFILKSELLKAEIEGE